MNKNAIQKFAIWARNELISQVSQRAYQYGIEESGFGDASADAIGGRLLTAEEKSQRQELIRQIREKGYKQVMEEVAYTWFNRFTALRFMEVNNYLPSHIRVFSDSTGAFKPEILGDALHLDLPGLDGGKVAEYIESNDTEGLYRYLLLTQCNALNDSLPVMFERMGGYTEMLLPNNILRQDSVLGRMVEDKNILDNDWLDAVQIIGWLYQYYNDERKNEVINIYKGTVKKEDIPAATQLFTTDWVVRYMVDNSLGRYWIERHPDSKLADKLEFFVTPKNGEIKHIDESVKPEEIEFFDPCMGSGHILVYAFDVFVEIYKECGYTERDAAAMIVQNNLFGLDIDDRAAQLAYFAVMMRARRYDRRFLTRGIEPNVYAITESNDMHDIVRDNLNPDARMNEISRYLAETFRDAKELGSIVTVEPKNYDEYLDYLDHCEPAGLLETGDSEWFDETQPKLKALAHQAKILTKKYHVVCTNPPYLNKMEGNLKTFVNDNFKDYSGDLFSVFMCRNLAFCEKDGYCGFMTPFVWMFIKTYEKLREYIIRNKHISTLVQMEYSAFEEATVPICSFVLKNGKSDEKGLYFKLSDFKGGMDVQKEKVLTAIQDKNCGYFYEAEQANFSKIPGCPVAYWVGERFLSAFETGIALKIISRARSGAKTGNNDLFLRNWWEVDIRNCYFNAQDVSDCKLCGKKWFPHNKGGNFRNWYGNRELLINFENAGENIKKYGDAEGASYDINAQDVYFHEGITWTALTSSKNSFRFSPTGCVFDSNKGPMIFPNSEIQTYYILALLNSHIAQEIFKLLNPSLSLQNGDVDKLPVYFTNDSQESVVAMSKENVILSKSDWDSYEISWDFKKSPLI